MDDTTYQYSSLRSNDWKLVITTNLYLLLIHIKQQIKKLITLVKNYIYELLKKTFEKLAVPYSIDRNLAFCGAMARTIEDIAKVEDNIEENGSYLTKRGFRLTMFWYLNIVQALTLIRYISWAFIYTPASIFWLHDHANIYMVQREFSIFVFFSSCCYPCIINMAIHLEEELAIQGKSKLFELFVAIRYPHLAPNFGISKLAIKSIRFVYKIGTLFLYQTFVLGPLTGFICTCVLWSQKYGDIWKNPWSIMMISQTCVWGLRPAISSFYVIFFFFLTCYMFHFKLIELSLKFKKISKSNEINVTEVEQLLICYGKVCREIELYNRTWNRYVALSYLFFIIVESLINVSLFFDKDPLVWRKFMHMWICIDFGIALAFLAYSGDIVSRTVFKAFYTSLNTLATHDYPTETKLRLMTAIEMCAGNFVNTRMFNTQKKLVGFSALNIIYISDNDYINVSHNNFKLT